MAKSNPKKVMMNAKGTMVSVLMNAVIEELKLMDEPYKNMKEAGQKRVIKSVELGVKDAIEKAVDILAAEERHTVVASVEKVTFGKGVQVSISASADQVNILDLAQHKKKGGRVNIIMIDNDVHGSRMEGAPVAEKDQKPLPLEDKNAPDQLLEEAKEFIVQSRKASISAVQRKLKIGYNRAARLIEDLEKAKVVSPMQSNGSRSVLISNMEEPAGTEKKKAAKKAPAKAQS